MKRLTGGLAIGAIPAAWAVPDADERGCVRAGSMSVDNPVNLEARPGEIQQQARMQSGGF